MDIVEIPDDFYINYTYNALCHKSCVVKNNRLSNHKFYFIRNSISSVDIAKLRYRCNTIDEIEERTYFC
jgi:hypothetical protein